MLRQANVMIGKFVRVRGDFARLLGTSSYPKPVVIYRMGIPADRGNNGMTDGDVTVPIAPRTTGLPLQNPTGAWQILSLIGLRIDVSNGNRAQHTGPDIDGGA